VADCRICCKGKKDQSCKPDYNLPSQTRPHLDEKRSSDASIHAYLTGISRSIRLSEIWTHASKATALLKEDHGYFTSCDPEDLWPRRGNLAIEMTRSI